MIIMDLYILPYMVNEVNAFHSLIFSSLSMRTAFYIGFLYFPTYCALKIDSVREEIRNYKFELSNDTLSNINKSVQMNALNLSVDDNKLEDYENLLFNLNKMRKDN